MLAKWNILNLKYSPSNRFYDFIIFFTFSPHFPRLSRIGSKVFPISVREYSTFGGTTGYTFLFTMWFFSRLLSSWASILWVIHGRVFLISEYLKVFSFKCQMIRNFHFPQIISKLVWIGQVGEQLFFIVIS